METGRGYRGFPFLVRSLAVIPLVLFPQSDKRGVLHLPGLVFLVFPHTWGIRKGEEDSGKWVMREVPGCLWEREEVVVV